MEFLARTRTFEGTSVNPGLFYGAVPYVNKEVKAKGDIRKDIKIQSCASWIVDSGTARVHSSTLPRAS
jgi:hypothetical protein